MKLLRPGVEMIQLTAQDPQTMFQTIVSFNNRATSVNDSLDSIYTTLFVIVLLVVSVTRMNLAFGNFSDICVIFVDDGCPKHNVVLFFIFLLIERKLNIACNYRSFPQAGTYFFSQDVNVLVIGPIEKMVELVSILRMH